MGEVENCEKKKRKKKCDFKRDLMFENDRLN
jgi:hypothetical protein